MDLQSLTITDLHPLPLRELAAVCLNVCRRFAGDDEFEQTAKLHKTLDTAEAVLQARASSEALHEPVEALYRMAATAAARHRIEKDAAAERLAIVGTVLYATIDCIADLDRDPDAALMSAMLALRTCGKLGNVDAVCHTRQDMILLLESHTG
ncbi:hypothetical protein [Rubinisphaera sp. JC750]|uniref:hypothetical protein n=1 Tax=Rubinisphaera sp. JC750 TaxID=2898658 RepID=UPI001F45DBDE|nr:hypothetical protein [Rubinisphaera sp. JC750]